MSENWCFLFGVFFLICPILVFFLGVFLVIFIVYIFKCIIGIILKEGFHLILSSYFFGCFYLGIFFLNFKNRRFFLGIFWMFLKKLAVFVGVFSKKNTFLTTIAPGVLGAIGEVAYDSIELLPGRKFRTIPLLYPLFPTSEL